MPSFDCSAIEAYFLIRSTVSSLTPDGRAGDLLDVGETKLLPLAFFPPLPNCFNVSNLGGEESGVTYPSSRLSPESDAIFTSICKEDSIKLCVVSISLLVS